ncbi:MAG TPA: DUF503 domain-containing protein [Tissierellaceae bacterium]|nr:DUF503 domain-containing protein [Tissierellaceae bacterium]
MIVGTCSIKLRIFETFSLKEKRQVIKSVIGRLKSRFNISVAEMDLHDNWQIAMIGFACVTNNTKHANETISKVLRFIDADSRIEIIDSNIELL